MTAALAADRASSRGPVILRQVPDGTGTTSPGSPPVPGRRRARLPSPPRR
ncbi:hypothetical protein ACFQU2_09200 [Siccirubricoccus deserti]